MLRPTLEIADIFRDHGPAWRAANVGHVSTEQRASKWTRTVALSFKSDQLDLVQLNEG
jgi:hypothetical protein